MTSESLNFCHCFLFGAYIRSQTCASARASVLMSRRFLSLYVLNLLCPATSAPAGTCVVSEMGPLPRRLVHCLPPLPRCGRRADAPGRAGSAHAHRPPRACPVKPRATCAPAGPLPNPLLRCPLSLPPLGPSLRPCATTARPSSTTLKPRRIRSRAACGSSSSKAAAGAPPHHPVPPPPASSALIPPPTAPPPLTPRPPLQVLRRALLCPPRQPLRNAHVLDPLALFRQPRRRAETARKHAVLRTCPLTCPLTLPPSLPPPHPPTPRPLQEYSPPTSP